MKRMRRVQATDESQFDNEIWFTPNDVRLLLLQINELKDYDIALAESFDGSALFIVGGSMYRVSNGNEGLIFK